MRQTMTIYFKHHQFYPSKGFTLVELIFTLMIIAVLAVIAVPMYNNYLIKARRAEAKAMLERAALWMERNQSSSFSYDKDAEGKPLTANSLADQGLGKTPENAAVGKEHYLIQLENIASNSFQIIATAQGEQKNKDVECAVLVRTYLGERGRKEPISNALDFNSSGAINCWAS